jgi:iron complex outermembrane receptor protein
MEIFRKNRLALAVKAGLGLGAGLAMVGPNLALAEDDEGYIEEVIVTGSRIKQADLENANPVTVLERNELLATGMTDVGDLIQRLPSMSGSPIGTTTNNGGNGSVTIDLRGIGAGRTLNLVNGKRSVDGGDYQAIPSNIIERIEILKDGAAAAYGADAVAGVVNIITRRDYEGFEIELITADGFDMDDGQQKGISIMGGKAWDDGHIVFGAEFIDQSAAYQSDAPWDFFQNAWYIYPGGCEAQVTAPYDGTPSGGCYPLGSSRIPEGRLRFGLGGTWMNEDGSGLVPYDGRSYNYAPVNYIQTPYEKTNLYFAGRFDIADGVELTTEIRGNFRESAQELAPQPYNSPTDPSYRGTWNPELVAGLDLDENGVIGTAGEGDDEVPYDLAYAGISPDNYYLRQAIAGTGILPGVPVIDARRRMVETTRRFTQDVGQVQANFELTGTIGEWDWNAYYNFGRRQSDDLDYGQFYGPFLANAMGPSADLDGDGSPECYGDINDPSTKISGCVPFNFFGGAYSVTQEMLDYVGVVLTDTFEAELDQFGFGITGSGFELPGGDIGWAAGYEQREESLTFSPDSGKQAGEVTGNKGKGTSGGYKVDSFYAELLAPIADTAEISVGYRWDDFSSYGSGDVWKVGFRWDILDSLAVRATWGEVFKAPDVFDLYQGEVDSFPTYLDPCGDRNPDPIPSSCAQVAEQLDTQVRAKVGGNPGLEAETGETFTAGVVYRPVFGNVELAFTADYWEVELEDGITSLGVNFILNDCYYNDNQGACSLITRRADYTIAQIKDAPINAALLNIAGVDLGIDADWSMGNAGDIKASILWTHNLKSERQSFPGDSTSDLIGRYTGSAFAEDKANYSVTWTRGDFSVAYLGEYIGELEAGVSFIGSYTQQIDSQLYHDLILGYTLAEKTSISLGLTNFTDEAPPYIDLGFNASTDPSTYRLFGSSYYMRLVHRL